MSAPYVRVLRARGVAVPLFTSFLGALPIGMLGLALILMVQSWTGSLVMAGIVTGLFGAGNAIGVLVQGVCIDRLGQSVVLVAASVLCLGSLLGLVSTGPGHAMAAGALALGAGVGIPATPTAMRSLWPALLHADELRAAAYALQGVVFTAAHLAAPLLVSGLLLIADPCAGVLAAGLLAAAGGVGFAVTPAARAWRPAGAGTRWSPRGLATAGMRTLVGSSVGIGVASGLMRVAVPAAAVAQGAPAVAGVLFALASVGDAVAGFLYGSRSWRTSLAVRLVLAESAGVVSAAALVGVATLGSSVWLLAPVMVLVGGVRAVAGITTTTLLDTVAAPAALTESYASTVCSGIAGGALGNGIAGGLGGPLPALWAAVVTRVVVVAWLAGRRRSLQARGDQALSARG